MRMNDQEFRDYCDQIGLTPIQTAYVKRMRSNSPVRAIGANRSHGCVRYASSKNNSTIDCESRNLEHCHKIINEVESNIIEEYAQPDVARIKNLRPGAKPNAKIVHYPDALLICKDSIKVVEYKLENKLREIQRDKPWLINKCENGRFHNPAAEEYYADFGIQYEIRTEKDFDLIEVANLDVLEPYFNTPFDIPKSTIRLLRRLIKPSTNSSDGATIENLLLHEKIDIDIIYQAIASGHVQCDLTFRPVTEHCSFRLFTTHNDVERFKKLRSLVLGSHQEELEYSPAMEILLRATDKDLDKTHQRLDILNQYWKTKKIPEGVAKSTFYDHLASYRKGEEEYDNGFIGLIPNYWKCGPSESTLMQGQIDIFVEMKETHFDDDSRKTINAFYTKYFNELLERGFPGISEKTFRKLLRDYETKSSLKKREGHKNANTEYGAKVSHEFGGFKKGLFPWHVTHIDHTQMDLFIKGGISSGLKVKPWLTTLFDPSTSNIGAWYISLNAPSAVNTFMVLRRFIYRHGVTPRYIVFDGGSDFKSVPVEKLLARLNISKISRRTSTPTDGPEEERLNLTINKELLYNLKGNNQALHKARSMDPSHDPRKKAVWNLQSLVETFELYVDKHYHNKRRDSIGCTPAEKFTQERHKIGERTLIQRANLQEIEHLTQIKVRSHNGMAKSTRHGIRMQHVYFGKDELGKKTYQGKRFPCLWDPDDIRFGYVYVQNSWKKIPSKFYGFLKNLSPQEISYFSREFRYLMSKANLDKESELRHYNKLLSHIEEQEFLLAGNDSNSPLVEQKFQVVRANQNLESALDYSSRTPAQLEALRDFF